MNAFVLVSFAFSSLPGKFPVESDAALDWLDERMVALL
jgi:hypothetical protein